MFFFLKDSDIKIKPKTIEHAYLLLLEGSLAEARVLFESLDSPRAFWGIVLTDIINGYLENYPTYFEIRNFLEIDLDFFIKNKKFDYVEQILGGLEFLVKINQEVYKYVARVMFENKIYDASIKYLEKSKKIFYKDPELHFLFAKYFICKKDFNKALFYINECINILPDYYPAKKLKHDIIQNLA